MWQSGQSPFECRAGPCQAVAGAQQAVALEMGDAQVHRARRRILRLGDRPGRIEQPDRLVEVLLRLAPHGPYEQGAGEPLLRRGAQARVVAREVQSLAGTVKGVRQQAFVVVEFGLFA